MNPSLDTPMYNLKAVVQETGLKPDTLRAWERRYGLPEPQRTDSGHRLYSQNDINMLKWLIARQAEGMSISRAVELWRSVQQAPFAPHQNSSATLTSAAAVTPELTSPIGQSDRLKEFHDAWVESCMNFDEQKAEYVITQAFALFPVEIVCLELIQRSLATIGEGWYKGAVTVQQEHFASALAMRRLEALLSATPAPTRAGRILVGCPPEEVHTFAPLLLSLLLRRKGWDILFLGANIPMQNMILTMQTAKPALVILTAQQLYTAASLYEMAQLLAPARISLAFGGKIFSELQDLQHRIPGHYLGDQMAFVTHNVEQLMTISRPQIVTNPVTPEYSKALSWFRASQSRIEAEVWRVMGLTDMPHEHLGKANVSFSRNIVAALTLGNINYIGSSLPWIKGLLSNHYQMPTHLVDNYLNAYLNAIELQSEDQGDIISQWLRRVLTAESTQ